MERSSMTVVSMPKTEIKAPAKQVAANQEGA